MIPFSFHDACDKLPLPGCTSINYVHLLYRYHYNNTAFGCQFYESHVYYIPAIYTKTVSVDLYIYCSSLTFIIIRINLFRKETKTMSYIIILYRECLLF